MKKLTIGLLAVVPTMSFAAGGLKDVIATVSDLANDLYALVFVLIVLAFAWGVLKFVFQSGDDQTSGKNMMLWSIIALFILVSVWGIITILQKTLGLDGGETINAPKIPVPVSTS